MVIATMLGSALAKVVVPVALGASEPSPCRVRNVTQDTVGHSLKTMVEATQDVGTPDC